MPALGKNDGLTVLLSILDICLRNQSVSFLVAGKVVDNALRKVAICADPFLKIALTETWREIRTGPLEDGLGQYTGSHQLAGTDVIDNLLRKQLPQPALFPVVCISRRCRQSE